MKKRLCLALGSIFILGIIFTGTSFGGPKTAGIVALEKKGVGKYLAFNKGDFPRTIYTYKKDKKNKSLCPAKLLRTYPPLTDLGMTAEKKKNTIKDIEIPSSLKSKNFTWIKIAGSKKLQLCYKGKPLYLFSKDTTPVDIKGLDKKHLWSLFRP
jgi:predicted lipoprotein with Yx(FWY)xxD motif